MNTNCKAVKTAIRAHIQEFYTPEELANEVQNLRKYDNTRRFPTNYHAVKYMVEGGCFLCYYYDVQNFLNSLGINPENKEYSAEKSWNLYCHLIARDSELLIKNANSSKKND